MEPENLIYIDVSLGTGVSDKIVTLFGRGVHQLSFVHTSCLYHCNIVGSSILNVDNEVGR